MINTVADLLNEFSVNEQQLLRTYEIVKHPGIIGDMYEGLTKDILDKAIFKNLNLNVRAGKIKNSKGELSGEIDCMLVIGEGDKIPYTDKFIYDSSKVIAVIQVKKNLYTKDIDDSFRNLKSVVDVTEERDGEPYHGRIVRSSYRMICREDLPKREHIKNLPFEKEMIYHHLFLEAFYPARIVWGYNGFASEFSLRESFVDYLGTKTSTPEKKHKGYDPLGFPNLIICGQYSIVKNNGIPFGYPIDEDLWWPLLVTSYDNPVYFFLEILWTRLHFMFGISSEIFGEDLKLDEMHGFLLARAKATDEMKGWEYFYLFAKDEELSKPLNHIEWQPAFLDACQFVIMNELCGNLELRYREDKDFESFVSQNGYTVDSFLKSLRETGLVHTDQDVIKLITENCVCGVSPTGKYYAGDNKSGRVERWVLKELERRKKEKKTNDVTE